EHSSAANRTQLLPCFGTDRLIYKAGTDSKDSVRIVREQFFEIRLCPYIRISRFALRDDARTCETDQCDVKRVVAATHESIVTFRQVHLRLLHMGQSSNHFGDAAPCSRCVLGQTSRAPLLAGHAPHQQQPRHDVVIRPVSSYYDGNVCSFERMPETLVSRSTCRLVP